MINKIDEAAEKISKKYDIYKGNLPSMVDRRVKTNHRMVGRIEGVLITIAVIILVNYEKVVDMIAKL